jgi:ABC-type Mn2+/Zn2+ transport system ATPase subunit
VNELILKTTGLSLSYGAHGVLRGVDMEVRAGEFWFLLGPNGVGKTTFLRAVLGLITPQAGRLWMHPQLACRERIGFVPQRCDLNPTLPTTVQEFVLLGLVGIRAGRAEQHERLSWALDKVGLGALRAKDYWSLSGGQRQRALVARALVRRPTLLILDEPTNGLDPSTEDALLQLLGALSAQEHQTMLFVTHDLAAAVRYATHVALFRNGGVATGRRDQVLDAQNLERLYGAAVVVHCDPSSMDVRNRGGTP